VSNPRPAVQLNSAYWQLGRPDRDLSLRGMLCRFPGSVRPILGFVWQAAPRAASAVVILQVVAGLLAAYALLAVRDVLDGLLLTAPSPDRVRAAMPALALIAAALAVRAAVETASTFVSARISPAVRRAAEGRLLAVSLRAELAAYDDPGFYDRLHRARDRGLPQLEQATTNVVELLGALLGVLAAAGAMSVLHPGLLPVLALSLLPEAWAVLRTAQLRYASMLRTVVVDRRVRMVSELATARESAAEIRASQAAPFLLDEYRQVADVLHDEQVRVARAGARAQATGRLVGGAAVAGTFALLAVLVYLATVPLAVAGAAVVAIRVGRAALVRVVQTANQLLEQGLYVADYRDFLIEATGRTRVGGTRTAPAAPREITLREVVFRYPGSASARPALDGIDLTIRGGESIALVGANGSGKTTLARLVAGLYEPTGGAVLWDGTDTRELDPDSLADRILMVQQDPVRWPNDARTNVRIGRHDRVDPDDVGLCDSARLARADEVIDTLPNGWGTLLSKYFAGGHELSGGQWQRIAVARGLFRDAPVLIWDEPTAPLDPAAEYSVYESLRAVSRGRTVILITHRLASVRHVDRICLVDAGKIAEQGSHAELLAAGGRYAKLYELQSRMYRPDDDPVTIEPREPAWHRPH
jgi:ATP-binding cassette, subfamily B, bacterial